MADGSPPPRVYQLRVWLRGISPMVWRRLLVSSDSTVADLHYTLQIAMGWENDHLHRFHIHGKDYGITYPGGIGFADHPHAVRLVSFDFRARERFVYEYDFTDAWLHDIRVERILAPEPKRTYPVCLAGKRAAPPEDCGGPRAFLRLRLEAPCELWRRLAQLAEAVQAGDRDAIHDQLERLEPLREWLALERFDRRCVNRRLRQYARGEREWLFAQKVDEGGEACAARYRS